MRLLGLVFVAAVLTACNPFEPKYQAPEMPASPYHFTLSAVGSEIEAEEQEEHKINISELSGKVVNRLNTGLFTTHPAGLAITWKDYQAQIDDMTYKLSLSAEFYSEFRGELLAQGTYMCVAEGTQPFELLRKARAKFDGEAFTMNEYAARIWNELLEQCLDELAADYLNEVQTATLP